MPDFKTIDGRQIAFTRSGDGPPLLLLHGFPQTHAMWTPLIPALAEQHTVIWASSGSTWRAMIAAGGWRIAWRSMCRRGWRACA